MSSGDGELGRFWGVFCFRTPNSGMGSANGGSGGSGRRVNYYHFNIERLGLGPFGPSASGSSWRRLILDAKTKIEESKNAKLDHGCSQSTTISLNTLPSLSGLRKPWPRVLRGAD